MNEVDFYLALPWTIVPSKRDDDGEYTVLEIAELPGFVVAGADDTQLEREFWDALRLFLETQLAAGDSPPVPAGVEPMQADPEEAERPVQWNDETAAREAPASTTAPGSRQRTTVHPHDADCYALA